jgi:2-dehydro-3-deoxygluconokinase
MSEFITIGEPMAVLTSTQPDVPLSQVTNWKQFLAGAELNVAVGIARLGHSTQYISSVGNDPFGQYIIDQTQKNNVGTDYLNTDSEYPTGHYLKASVTKGDPQVSYFRKGSAAANFDINLLNKIDLTDVKIAHLSGIFAALSNNSLEVFKKFVASLEEKNIFTTFDPNLRPTLWKDKETMVSVTNELAKNGKIVMPGINEGEILMGSREPNEIADFYLSNSSKTEAVIVKLGPSGSYVKEANGNEYVVPGFKAEKVVDTVGAGDGFALGVISALLEGLSIEEAALRGNAVGSLAVQSAGDSDGYPTKEQLIKFMN